MWLMNSNTKTGIDPFFGKKRARQLSQQLLSITDEFNTTIAVQLVIQYR
uniref:Branched-chain-amino-acid aminotransferase 3ic-like isoform X1 n=1 Tax=Rhizophora mucronata TaxID=61149 RepID=A0A2P2KDJ8_RHIMU